MGELSFTADPLTGLATRPDFELSLAELTRAPGAVGSLGVSGSVAILDLDHFTAVNGRYGAQVGDEVLRACASRFREVASSLPRGTLLARIANDEFALAVPGLRPEGVAEALSAATLGWEPIPTAAGLIRTTFSAGVAEVVAGEDQADAMRRADRAVFQAKCAGRSTILAYDASTERFAHQRRDLFFHLDVLRARMERMGVEVRTDPLTDLGNRRALDEWLHRFDRAHDRFRQPLAILFIDLDRFHAFHHVRGQESGDEALRQVARVLAKGCRPTDLPFRRGGEEFVVLLPSTGLNEALVVAERLRQAVAALAIPHGGEPDVPTLTVTVVAAQVTGRRCASEAIEAAAQAAFAAKDTAGRDVVLVADPT